MSNTWNAVAPPDYAGPVVNWFGGQKNQQGQPQGKQMAFQGPQPVQGYQPPGQQTPVQAQPLPPVQPAQAMAPQAQPPAQQSAGWADPIVKWLQGLAPAQQQNPASGGMGLPQGNQTGSLY